MGRAVVANAYQVKLIAAARVKTDKHDAWSLARLLVADLIPEVWVVPVHVRELRALISHRRRLIQIRTRARNRLHSRHDLETLDHVDGQLETVDDELNRLTTVEPWPRFYPYLVQLPGFGLVVSMTVLSAIGDITRFPTAKHLTGYAGLGASVHDSGKTHRTGRITKQGRRELRWVLVQAAWVAVNTHPHWKEQHQRLTRRKPTNKSIVAIARKLLVVVWHALTERVADRKADEEVVAFKLMLWSWKLGKERRGGLSTPQFVRAGLMRLEMGEDLSHIIRGGTVRPIASVEEVLALQSAA